MWLVSQDNAPQNGNFDRELFDKTTVCGLSLKIMQIGAPEVESDYLERFMQFYANEQESKNKVAVTNIAGTAGWPRRGTVCKRRAFHHVKSKLFYFLP